MNGWIHLKEKHNTNSYIYMFTNSDTYDIIDLYND